jgi:hypothetical protein
MEQLQQLEWCELRSNTWHLLRRREHILRWKHWPLLQYLAMPSFTDTWCIDVVRTGEDLTAYYTVWRMTQDIEAFATAIERIKHPRPFIPTLASTQLEIGPNVLVSLLERFGQIEIPLLQTRNSICVDGASYELQIGDGWTGIMLQWHNDLPDEWPPELQTLVRELNEMASRHAAQASDARERRSRAN